MPAEVELGTVGLDSEGNVGFEVKQSWARTPNQPLGLGTWLWGKTPRCLALSHPWPGTWTMLGDL